MLSLLANHRKEALDISINRLWIILPKGNLTAFPTIKSSNRKVFDEIRSHFLFNFKKINSEQFQKLSIYKSSIVQFYNLETDTAMEIFLVHLKVCCKVYIKQ